MKELYVFAHPDDEIAIAGRIQRNRDNFHGIWLTNGDLHGNGEQRIRESCAAMRFLKLARNRSLFFGIGEKKFTDIPLLKSLKKELSRIACSLRPDRVYINAYEGGHFVHDVANFLIRNSFPGRVYEFPLYSLKNGKKPKAFSFFGIGLNYLPCFLLGKVNVGKVENPDEVIFLSEEELCKKRTIKKFYKSQKAVQFWFNIVYPGQKERREMIREIPKNRDYARKPKENLLYEIGPRTDFPVKGEKFPYFLHLINEIKTGN